MVPAFKCRYDLGVLGHDVRVGDAALRRRHAGFRVWYWDLPLPDAHTDARPLCLSGADGDALADRRAVPRTHAATLAVPHFNQVQGVQRRNL